MKQQDLIKYHHASITELEKALDDLGHQLVDSRLRIKLGQEKNLHLHKNIRHDIAKIKTIIRHQQLTGKPATTKPLPQSRKTTPSKKSSPQSKPKQKDKK